MRVMLIPRAPHPSEMKAALSSQGKAYSLLSHGCEELVNESSARESSQFEVAMLHGGKAYQGEHETAGHTAHTARNLRGGCCRSADFLSFPFFIQSGIHVLDGPFIHIPSGPSVLLTLPKHASEGLTKRHLLSELKSIATTVNTSNQACSFIFN